MERILLSDRMQFVGQPAAPRAAEQGSPNIVIAGRDARTRPRALEECRRPNA